MSSLSGWRTARGADQKKSSRGSSNRRWGYRWKFDQVPTKVHFTLPEKPYRHPDTGLEFPFRFGQRYWVPWAGKDHKGAYIEVGEQDVIAAYKNPAAYGLKIEPKSKYNKLDPKIYYAVSGFVEEWFHLVKKQNPNTQAEYHERERCVGHNCEHCKKQIPKVFGKKVYFEIARTHWNESIFSVNERVGSNCKCGGFIYTPHYECQQCHELLVDVMHRCFSCGKENIALNTESAEAECQDCHATWSIYESDNPEVSKVVNKDMKCPKCGFEGLPTPSIVCTNCQKPDAFGVFDCQMKIMMVGSADGKSKEMRIEDVVVQPPDTRLFEAKFQGPEAEQAQKTVDFFAKPMNLDTLLAAPTPDEQATTLGEANPFSSKGGTSQGFKSYSRDEAAAPEQAGDAPDEEPEEVVATAQRPKVAAPAGRVIGKINIRR